MGNLIKINIYVEKKNINNKEINLKKIEENISSYNEWLKSNHREDKIENYENFLRAQ